MAHPYAALIPAFVERHLAIRPPGPAAPWHRRTEGAILLADVAGFTALAETYTEGGAAGVERLSALLSTCFGRLSDRIAAYGGDVVGFAGDAPVALFETGVATDAASGASGLERAAACAAALQAVMPDLAAAAGHPLALRIAVASGPVTELVVGGVRSRWQWLVGGPPIDRLGGWLSTVAPGGTVVDGTPVAHDAGPAEPPAAWQRSRLATPADACRPFVTTGVASRLDAGQDAWAAELRRVTTLFVSLRGCAYDHDDSPAAIQTIVASLQQAIYDADGAVNQLIVDDKGTTLVAGWGLPGSAHDDDPARASRAAVEVARVLRMAGVAFGAGLGTGRVFCGWRGNARRREFALIGSVVNLAARLAGAASDAVLADEATWVGGRHVGTAADATTVVLKGRGEVTAYHLAATRARAPEPGQGASLIVGRATERARLAGWVDDALAGRGGVVFVSGDAGAGKSTIVAEAAARAHASGAAVFHGAGAAVERGTGYAGWRSILEGLLGLAPDADAATRIEGLQGVADPDLRDRAPLLAPILDVAVDDTPTTGQMTAPLRAAGARELLVRLVGDALTRRPVVLIFEDAHWLDSLSWSALAAATRRLPGLLAVCSLRPVADPPQEATALSAHRDTRHVELGPLDQADAIALSCGLLGVDRVPDTVRALIRDKCGGHPLFVTEFTRWLLDTGTVVVSGATCRHVPAHGTPVELPASVEGVILHRLDRLPPPLQLTLRVASVLGETFTAETLRALHPAADAAAGLDAQLVESERLGFLQATPTGVAFTHALVRDAAYQLTPPSQRTILHRAVADWLDRSGTESPPDAVLAYHREGAGQVDLAVTHLGRAGHTAWSQGAARETIRFLERAIALADREGIRLEALRHAGWHRLAGQAQVIVGDLPASRGNLRQAFALLGTSFPFTPGATRRRLIAEVARQAMHVALPRRRLRAPSTSERDRTVETIRTLKAVGEAAYFETDHLTYIAAGLAAINRAERVGVQAEAATGYAGAAYTASLLKLGPLARRWWRLAGRPDDVEARLTLLTAQSMAALQEARWYAFDTLVDELVTTARRLGAAQYLDTGLVARLIGEFQQGQLEASLGTARTLLESASAQFNEQHQLWAHQAISSFLRLQGDDLGADRHTAEAIDLLAVVTDPLTIAQHYAHRLEAANSQGDLAAAAPLAAEVGARIRATPPASVGTLGPYLELTRYGIDAWTREAASAGRAAAAGPAAVEARWACQQLGRYAFLFPYARPYHAALSGRIDWLRGRRRRAIRRWLAAVRLARRLSIPSAEAEALACLGRFAHAGTAAGRQYREEAAAVYRRIGFVVAAEAATRTPVAGE